MEPNEQQYLDNLLDKYLRGECSTEEKILIDSLYDQLRVTNRNMLEEEPVFAQRAEQQLLTVLRDHVAEPPVKVLRLTRKKYLNWAVAASLTGLSIVSVFLYLSRRSQPARPIAKTAIQTSRNQRKEIMLPDSSIVWLNQYSTLTWQGNLHDSLRLVQLTGEARFKVTHDASRPFIVQTGATYTKVLGTEFNIEAYNDEKEIKVSLLQGKVQFGEGLANKTLAVLQPGNMATYSRRDRSCQVSPIGNNEVDSWTKGAIVFNEVPLQEAIHRLALRYDWQITWNNSHDSIRLPGTTVTGTFRRETPEQMLAAIAFTNHFRFRIKNKKVTIY